MVLGFVLDRDGAVRLARVIDQSSDTFRMLGTESLAAAAPFGELVGDRPLLIRAREAVDHGAHRVVRRRERNLVVSP